MATTIFDPFSEIIPVRELVNRLINESFISPRAFTGDGGFASFPFDLYETADDLVVRAAIPGAEPGSFELSVNQDVLTVKGQRGQAAGQEAQQYTWHMRGLSSGPFQMQIALPVPVSADAAQASYENGILTIHMPKAEQARVKRIAVSTAGRQEALPAGAR
jgi:HSP20 family protein